MPQFEHEQRAEAAVAASAARHHTTKGNRSHDGKDPGSAHQPSREKREFEAAKLAARRAAGHIPGAFVE